MQPGLSTSHEIKKGGLRFDLAEHLWHLSKFSLHLITSISGHQWEGKRHTCCSLRAGPSVEISRGRNIGGFVTSFETKPL